MQTYRLKFRTKYNHPDFVISLTGLSASIADWLFEFLEAEVRSGVVFGPEEIVQVGWVIVMLKADNAGDLEIWEPDFARMPIVWSRGVGSTLRFLLVQREICDRVGVDPAFPSLQQAGVVSTDFLKWKHGFYMARNQTIGNDSGWVFRVSPMSDEKGQYVSLYNIALQRASVIPFLALPPGSSVRRSPSETIIELGSEFISSGTDKFLNSIHLSSAFG